MLRFLVPLCCVLFVVLGLCFAPYAGIQNDEAIFAVPLYEASPASLALNLLNHSIPLMISDHIGALKSWLYWPIFAAFRPTVFSIRTPMILTCALAIWIFFLFAKRTAGRGAALYAAVLLASDPSFLLTGTFDWGPVALERLLIVAACLSLVRFGQEGSHAFLAAGFFTLGLALWNRADFVWALAGFTVAAAVLWREILARMHWRTATLAAAAFIAGMLPLLIYNVSNPNATLSTNARVEFNRFEGKFQQLRATADGSDLIGFLVANDSPDHQKPAGLTTTWIAKHFGEHRQSGMFWAYALALMAVPLWWKSKTARFALVYMLITWLSMAVTQNAGAAAHHAMMLWPFPQLFLAVALAAIPWSWAAAGLVTLLVSLNLLVINQHMLQFQRDGAAGNFSDALYPLSDALTETPGQTIYITDWGIFDTVMLFHWGHLTLQPEAELVATETPNAQERQALTRILSDPQGLFIGHVQDRESFEGNRKRIQQAAALNGLQKQLLRIIFDSNARPVFEIFRFRPVH